MNPTVSSYLSLSTNPWLIIFGLLVFGSAVGIGYWNWRRSAYGRGVAYLEFLRLTIIAGIVFLLLEPEWVRIHLPSQKPQLQVLVDRSRSMLTTDATDSEAPGSPLVSRQAATERLLTPDAWAGLQERFDVRIDTFPDGLTNHSREVDQEQSTAPEPQGRESNSSQNSGTDLSAALQSALVNNQVLRSVIVVSDGDWNQGLPPAETAIKFRASDIPIHTISIGAEQKLPDLEVYDMDLPTFGIVDKSIRIPFSVASSLGRNYAVQATLEVDGSVVDRKEIRVSPMAKTQDFFHWTPAEMGERSVRISIASFPEEGLTENNALESTIQIREERLKVLVIETYPRWEYRFLRNALSRDPGVEVSCLLFHQKLDKMGGGNRDYLSEFPSDPEVLSEYDVIFIGDIGIGENQLSEEQCEMLRGLVEFQASGLVFLPGPYGFQNSLAESSLEPLIPVVADSTMINGRGDSTPMHFELTQSGRRSLLTKLSEQEDLNVDVWSSLPGFQWFMPVSRAKAGAEVLAVHQQAMNEFGRLPLIVTKPYGVGKVLYMATDGAWRWRRGVEDLYHYRFWGQVVRWMAYQRHMNRGESIRFYYSPESPQVGQKLALKVNVMSDSGEPVSTGNTTMKIQAPGGRSTVLQLKSAGADSWGLFEGEFTPNEAGKYQITLASSGTSQILEANLSVQGSAFEKVGEPAKPYVLQEISKITNGETFELSQIASLQNWVLDMPEPPAMVKRTPLWAHPLVMVSIVCLLTLFWIGRKRLGLL